MNDTELQTEFRKYGSLYTQVKRVGRVVLYRLTRNGVPKGYEVMVVQKRPPTVMPGGKLLPGGEALPSSSMWGVFGWSFLASGESVAEQRFASSCKHFNVRRLVRS